MSRQKLGLLLMFAVTLCLVAYAPSARAQECDRCVMSPTDGFGGWDSLEPTGYNPPSYVSCTARSGNNQKCRECAPAYFDNGTYKGYNVCAYVARNASCKCNNANTDTCSGEGSCTYLYY
jgi:hypothetical protein